MAIELEIRDGDPWWMSPDIWVVPGNDPEAAPGQPIVGTPAFLWARVRNNGSTGVQNATVRFYWADPSTGFDRNTAYFVGSSFVTLDPGQVGEVLCLQPWIPEFVNDGHECLLAEAFHLSGDPIPPSPDFNVPTDRHVAQRNISVVTASTSSFFSYSFNIFNTERKDRVFRLMLELGNETQLKPLIPTLDQNLGTVRLDGKLTAAAVAQERCAGKEETMDLKTLIEGLELKVPANRKINRTLIGKLEGGPALVHLLQRAGDRTIGGTSVLVLPCDTTQEK